VAHFGNFSFWSKRQKGIPVNREGQSFDMPEDIPKFRARLPQDARKEKKQETRQGQKIYTLKSSTRAA